jgi:hypothetical protein
MREWMAAQTGEFSFADIALGVSIPVGHERDVARNALGDFVRRGEIAVAGEKRNLRQSALYRYQERPAIVTRSSGHAREKIFKAMRLASFEGPFAAADIQRMTGEGRSHIDKWIIRLLKAGHVNRIGCRERTDSYGREAVYRVHDTNKFRVEVMK